MLAMNRNEMIEKLRTGTHVVVFTKVNGEERTMTCTLDPTFIPEAHVPKDGAKAINESVLAVFDTTAQGWRSFRLENVKSFS